MFQAQIISEHPLAFVLLLCITFWLLGHRTKYRLPPGPSGLPLFGNFWDIPSSHEWLKYEEWGRKYGSDIVHLQVANTHIFVINSTKAARELFDKRSSNYSDKVHSVMVHELTGWERNFNFMRYGTKWRAHRRMFYQHFRPEAVPTYHPTMRRIVRKSLGMVLDRPDEFVSHLRLLIGSTVLNVVFGIDAKDSNDPRIETVEQGMGFLAGIANPGGYLVDFLPILKHIPDWLPGAGFKRQGREWKPIVDQMFTGQYKDVKADYDKGIAKPCVLTTILDRINKDDLNGELEDQIINVTGIAYAAATDTTVATLSAFVQLMVLYPDVQAAAQAELNSFIGQRRLPELEDRGSLPYISAVLKEVMRLYPILPLAHAHRSVADDEYEGYHIPGGSVVIGNTWAILHDPDRYNNPYAFNPSRFLTAEGQLDPNVPDPIEAFGYSRRICAGRYFALDLLWLAISHILCVFDITRALDEHGRVVELSGKWTSGFICHPEPYKVTFRTRSKELEDLIRVESTTATED